MVECNPWFPDKGNFDLEIWHRVKKKKLNKPPDGKKKKIPIDIWPLWTLIKAVILPFQGKYSPHNIQQQTEHLLHEHMYIRDIFVLMYGKTNTIL